MISTHIFELFQPRTLLTPGFVIAFFTQVYPKTADFPLITPETVRQLCVLRDPSLRAGILRANNALILADGIVQTWYPAVQ